MPHSLPPYTVAISAALATEDSLLSLWLCLVMLVMAVSDQRLWRKPGINTAACCVVRASEAHNQN